MSSLTTRVRPAIRRGDSMRQIASTLCEASRVSRAPPVSTNDKRNGFAERPSRADYRPAAFCTSSGKSASSNTWRISMTSLAEAGHLLAQAIASAREATSIIQ